MLASLLTLLPIWFGNTVIQTHICQLSPPPILVSPISSSSVQAGDPIIVKGTALADASITLTDNGYVYAVVTADQANTFATQASFSAGSHTLGITSTDPCGNLTPGTSVTIDVTPAPITPPIIVPPSSPEHPPKFTFTPVVVPNSPTEPATSPLLLTILSPHDITTTSAVSVYMYGTTNKFTTEEVSVNGKVVASSKTTATTFGFTVPLEIGKNHITITATADTEQASHSLIITRLSSASATPAGPTTPDSSTPWYRTTPGKVAIVCGSLLIILLIILVVIAL